MRKDKKEHQYQCMLELMNKNKKINKNPSSQKQIQSVI